MEWSYYTKKKLCLLLRVFVSLTLLSSLLLQLLLELVVLIKFSMFRRIFSDGVKGKRDHLMKRSGYVISKVF